MTQGHNKFKSAPDNHDFMTEEHVAGFLRHHRTGVDNLGRQTLGRIIASYDNPTVADVACGTCVNWETFKNMGVQCRYTGIDRCQKLLSHAVHLYPNDSLNVQLGYVQDTGMPDDHYDVVIMRHILEHLEEGYESAIREGLRIASKELIVVFFLDPSELSEDDVHESEPDDNGCTYFWNTYSWPKFTDFVTTLGVQMKVGHVVTPGAAHADTIVRLIK